MQDRTRSRPGGSLRLAFFPRTGGFLENGSVALLRRIMQLREHTGRPVILYASAWLQKEAPPFVTSIGDEDIHALMEVTNGLRGSRLDLLLHSRGCD